MQALLDLWDEPALAPLPALVAASRPSPREVAQAASVLGWLSDERLFPVAVIDRGEEC
jgi:hypothetical protein